MEPTDKSSLPDFVESEIDLDLALEAHSIAIFEWDAVSGQITWAPGAEERLGQRPGTVTTYDEWVESVVPADLPGILEIVEKAVAERAPKFSYCFRLRNWQGDIRVYEGTARCIYADDGTLLKTVSVAADVTGRFEVRKALSASHDQFRSVLETSPTALVIANEAGEIVTFSRAAEDLFQRSATEVLGTHFNCLTDQRVRVLLTAAKRTKGEIHQLSALRADGSTVPVEVSVHEFGSAPELFTIFIRDISERLEAEQRMDTLRDELAHSARLNTMGEVAAGIAHELNQPLAAMTNYLGAARNCLKNEDMGPDQVERLIGLASQQALRAGDIIRKMREFLTRGDIDLQPYPVASLVKEAVSLTSLGGRHPRFDIRIDIADDLPEVMVDRIQIQQVIVNLIKNAVEELREHPVASPKVTISATANSGNHVTVIVKDNGPGLPDELLDHLYEPFTSQKPNGMGLGLSISRRIVEAHGSSLVGDNRESGGAVFRFNLPIAYKDDPS